MTLNDLPEIQITRNIRSTRLRLRVEPTRIRLTAPIFCTKKQIQSFIDQSETWLLQTWQAQQDKIIKIDRTLPTEIGLFNLDFPVRIEYCTQKNNFVFDAENLILRISDRTPENYLKAFVVEYAKEQLPIYLHDVSLDIGLKFTECSIRQPKTRWGSCSAQQKIMLNSALVLYSKEVVRYVCVHELAHTVHFNHSAQFWQLVHQHDMNFKTHQKQLKTTPVPYWWIT